MGVRTGAGAGRGRKRGREREEYKGMDGGENESGSGDEIKEGGRLEREPGKL